MRAKSITILFHFCGMVHEVMRNLDIPIKFVEPMEWKGQVKKEIHHPKIIKKTFSKYKVDVSKAGEDAIDAIGIGYWWLNEREPDVE